MGSNLAFLAYPMPTTAKLSAAVEHRIEKSWLYDFHSTHLRKHTSRKPLTSVSKA